MTEEKDEQLRRENMKRKREDILESINQMLGFVEYEDKIKWSQTNKIEMLRLENRLKELLKGESKI